MKITRLNALALGTALALGVASSAQAAILTYSWDPAGLGIAGITDGTFQANNQVISDYAAIAVNATTGAFTENAIVSIGQFDLNGTKVGSPLLTQFNGGSYQLYYTFEATGLQSSPSVNPPLNTTINGVFNTVSAQLWALNAPGATFSTQTSGCEVIYRRLAHLHRELRRNSLMACLATRPVPRSWQPAISSPETRR